MAVVAFDSKFGINGHAKSMKSFLAAHNQDSETLLNLAEGKEPDAPRPTYNPSHPDNQWPTMMHHPEKGELEVGTSLKGVEDTPGQSSKRASITRANEKAVAEAMKLGYRAEPYAAKQVVVLDPATEKLELKRKLDEQQGQITMLMDKLGKLTEPAPSPAA